MGEGNPNGRIMVKGKSFIPSFCLECLFFFFKGKKKKPRMSFVSLTVDILHLEQIVKYKLC